MAALAQFRPTIWASKLIVDVDEAFVFANLANRDYQGEITGKGNIVKINEIGSITVNDYTENADITIQTLTGAQKELVIDQAKYFAFNVDDVLAAQANVNVMSAAMQKAASRMRFRS
jgi:biopolymer transport protein ExbD